MARRIITSEDAKLEAANSGGSLVPDDFSERLVKLIPAEILGPYIVLKQNFAGIQPGLHSTLTEAWALVLVGVLTTFLYLKLVANSRPLELAMSLFIFSFYAIAMGGPSCEQLLPPQFLYWMGLALVPLPFMAPLLVRA